MTIARLYHNADCSKCRAALTLLLDRGVETDVVNYLEHPPTLDELRALLRRLGGSARDLLRPGDAAAAHLDQPGVTDAELLSALQANPRWLQRPILVVGDRAVIARPPERVLELLDGVN